MKEHTGRAYIAGGMTGYPSFNFPLFDLARDALLELGWEGVSPADLDRADGYDPVKNPGQEPLEYEACMVRDGDAMKTCTAIGFLPGWEASSGANREKETATDLGLEMWRLFWGRDGEFYMEDMHMDGVVTMKPVLEEESQGLRLDTGKPSVEQEIEAKLDNPQDSILMQAENLVNGARRQDYGHPYHDYEAVGRIWGAILTRWLDCPVEDVPPRIACLMMQGVKISREAHEPKRDNRVDGAGYWGCVDLIAQKGADDGQD